MAAQTGTLHWLPQILGDTTLDPTSTLLLIGLADHINVEDECFVGIETLAEYARCSYGTARRRLSALEASGHITRIRNRRDDGNLSTYRWRLCRGVLARNMRAGLARAKKRDDQRATESAMTSARRGARAEPPRREPPSTEPKEYPDHVTDLCDALADSIGGRDIRPDVSESWLRDMDRLIRLDSRTPEQVRRVICWLDRGDDRDAAFWRGNIRSPYKLRLRWGQMADQYAARRAQAGPSHEERHETVRSTIDAMASAFTTQPQLSEAG